MKSNHQSMLVSRTVLAMFAMAVLVGGCSWLPIERVNLPTATATDAFAESEEVMAQTTPAVRFLDVPYASQSDAQKLDIYIPSGGGPYPLVIIIHGGGFETGDKAGSNERQRINLLVRNGFAAASINYRLSGEAIYPAQIHDAKTAVRFLRSKAADYNIDPNRFGARGGSAGGNWLRCWALLAGWRSWKEASWGIKNIRAASARWWTGLGWWTCWQWTRNLRDTLQGRA